MITNILVPTDFSPVADNALRYAISLAQKTGSKIHMIHTDTIPAPESYYVPDAYSAYLVSLEQANKAGFENLKATLFKDSGIDFQSFNTIGFVNDEIIDYAEKHKIDLIVMGTTGASGVTELLIGSTTASLVTKSPVPVLVVPAEAEYRNWNHMIYATDYSGQEPSIVLRLKYLADLFDAKVTVFNVNSNHDKYLNAASSYFEARNKEHVLYKDWRIVESQANTAENGINDFVEEENPDLLVMARHNRNFFERIFHRSLSKRMAYHTKTPLLVLNKEAG